MCDDIILVHEGPVIPVHLRCDHYRISTRAINHLTETTEHLESDATGIYNQFHHMSVVAVSGLLSLSECLS